MNDLKLFSQVTSSSKLINLFICFTMLSACGGGADSSVNPVEPVNSSPKASNTMITDNNSGEARVSDILTGSYEYTDVDGDAEGQSVFRWYRNDELITSASELTYTLKQSDEGQSIRFEVTPVAVSGINMGIADTSLSITIAKIPYIFFADDGVHGLEPWITDGTEAGTVILKDMNPLGSVNLYSKAVNFKGLVYFTADDGSYGPLLWKTNGAEISTTMVQTNVPSMANEFSEYNGMLYFQAYNSATGSELWKTDGTETGTVLVKDINSGSGSSSPRSYVEFKGELYFVAYQESTGAELWKTDGTNAGTVIVKDINPGTGYGIVYSDPGFIELNDELFFQAINGIDGIELWKTDGTEVGTVMVKDINPSGNSLPDNFVQYSGAIYFTANDGSNSTQIWKTNGTDVDTVMLKDTNPTGPLIVFNKKLYFSAGNYNTTGAELWVSDGTASGTTLLKDINPGVDSSFPTQLTVFNGELFFSAAQSINYPTMTIYDYELWKSDGTTNGTVMVKNINSNTSSSPQGLSQHDGVLYFKAYDDMHGLELWKTDGTEAGTVLIKDINTGPDNS